MHSAVVFLGCEKKNCCCIEDPGDMEIDDDQEDSLKLLISSRAATVIQKYARQYLESHTLHYKMLFLRCAIEVQRMAECSRGRSTFAAAFATTLAQPKEGVLDMRQGI